MTDYEWLMKIRLGVALQNDIGAGRARTVRDDPLEDLIWLAVERWGRA